MPSESQPPESRQPSASAAAQPLVRITVEAHDYTIDLVGVVESASPERVLWWAELLGRAERERIMAEAAYRQWRGRRVHNLSMSHPKRAEWKVRAEVDGDRGMVESRLAVAERERAVVTLRWLVDVLRGLV